MSLQDLLEWKTAFSNVYLGLGAGIVLPVTLVMRKLISAKISSAQSMSENTRKMHKNLLKVWDVKKIGKIHFRYYFYSQFLHASLPLISFHLPL